MNTTLNTLQTEILETYQKANQEAPKGGVLFLGDSLVEFLPTDKLHLDVPIYNRGIRGSNSQSLRRYLKVLTAGLEPEKIVLLIGTNDLMLGSSVGDLLVHIEAILAYLKERFPKADCYLESLYPRRVSERYGSALVDEIAETNLYLRHLEAHFIDIYPHLVGDKGLLKESFTRDGVHLTYQGYQPVLAVLEEVLGQ
ncbi:GDSL-type esterase/lipase family protein [Streptococcus sp. zg-JUN1979]|uniref:GDSL-type esterase/lipase family protein n=1 Tax=Streptococcus sp. zg-JUN1979 TaxID=3391450 RepID=UPI0039A5639C